MAQSDKFHSKPTSIFWVCKALNDGRTITHQDEMADIGAWRLGAIIHRLKRESDWPVMVDYRGTEQIAHYSLAPDTDQANLRPSRSAKALCAKGGAA